jgi:hypothetical protein
MIVWLEIETWVIGKGGTKRGVKRVGELWKRYGSCWFLWSLHVFGYISAVVVEGVCVRDCRELGVCTVGTVGWSSGGECVQAEVVW